VLINLWLFLFSYFQHNQKIFLGWVKEVRITKSKVYVVLRGETGEVELENWVEFWRIGIAMTRRIHRDLK
jgi:hypothetical protein